MDELKKRKTPRYQSFNYNSVGVYFITICTQNRRSILSLQILKEPIAYALNLYQHLSAFATKNMAKTFGKHVSTITSFAIAMTMKNT